MTTKQLLQRGFTLIELLVVIAIIGILAAVVIGSLGDARTSGQDASIKQTMSGMRSAAEISYNSNSLSYDTVCTDLSTSLDAIVDAISGTPTINTTDGTASDGESVTCRDDDGEWAVIAPMNDTSLAAADAAWCIDSDGYAGPAAVDALAADQFVCQP